MAEQSGNVWKWLEMAGNNWKFMEMAGNGRRCVGITGKSSKGWIWLQWVSHANSTPE